MSAGARIRDEALEALRSTAGPLGRKEVMAQCPSADNVQQVSMALWELKRDGLAERTDTGWRLAETGKPRDNGKGTANSGKTGSSTSAPAPAACADAARRIRERSANGGAPAEQPPAPNVSEYEIALRESLRNNAANARYCFERFIEARGDKTLLALWRSVTAAEEALALINEGNHGGMSR